MDNASKALIMAGEILIAMLVVGMIVYAITKFGKFSSNMNKQISQNKQIVFNANFLKYQGRIDITADEIVTAINFAKNSNDSNELYLRENQTDYSDDDKNSPYFVKVNLIIENDSTYNGGVWDKVNSNNYNKWLTDFLNKYNENYFSCNIGEIKQNPIDNSLLKKDFIEITTSIDKNEDKAFGISNDSGGLVTQITFKLTPLITNYDKNGDVINFSMKNRELFVTK